MLHESCWALLHTNNGVTYCTKATWNYSRCPGHHLSSQVLQPFLTKCMSCAADNADVQAACGGGRAGAE